MQTHPLFSQLEAINDAIKRAATNEQRDELRKQLHDVMQQAFTEAGLSEADAKRLRIFSNTKTGAVAVIESMARLDAFGEVADFPVAYEVCRAALRDLKACASMARRVDALLDVVEPDGTGIMLDHPMLLDDDATGALFARIGDHGKNSTACLAAKAAMQAMRSIMPANDGGEFSPTTLLALNALGSVVGKALLPLTIFACRGNIDTAKALREMNRAMVRAAAEGSKLNREGRSGLFIGDGSARQQVAGEAMERVLSYVIEHGSSDGFDPVGTMSEMREKVVDAGEDASRLDETLARMLGAKAA